MIDDAIYEGIKKINIWIEGGVKNLSKSSLVISMARSIRVELYEKFYEGIPITFDVALKIVGEATNSRYIKDPNIFKELASKISEKYFEFIDKRQNEKGYTKKEFITEEELIEWIDEIVLKPISFYFKLDNSVKDIALKEYKIFILII